MQIARHAELGQSLHDMRAFARRVATTGVSTLQALKSTTEVPLQTAAKKLYETHEQQELRMKHAVNEINQLADDMLEYQKISKGACIP